MKIKGKLILVKNNSVYIKQFYTGYIYKAEKQNLRVEGTKENPVYVEGKLSVMVESEGIENFQLIAFSEKDFRTSQNF